MLAALPYGGHTIIRYSRILALLLSCEGVEDYTLCNVNSGQANFVPSADLTPIVGTIMISETV